MSLKYSRILWVDWLFGCYRVPYFLVQLPCLGVVCHFHNNFHGNFLRPPGNAKHAILGHRKTLCTRKMQNIFYFKAGMVTETWIGHSWTSNMISTQPTEPWQTTSLAKDSHVRGDCIIPKSLLFTPYAQSTNQIFSSIALSIGFANEALSNQQLVTHAYYFVYGIRGYVQHINKEHAWQ